MVPSWKRLVGLGVYFFLNYIYVDCQTTTLSTTTTSGTNAPEMTTPTTTFVPTLTPLPLTEGTTLATADSALPTSTVTTEESTVGTTTEGQASDEDLTASGLRGYRFESARNRPSANQEAAPETETETATTQKPEDKKIAWKFGRGGNNQGPWSSRPSPNSGYPVWKKEPSVSNAGQSEQGVEGDKNKQNEQGYLVWNVGQGNQPSGWTINGNVNSWAPAGEIPAGWVQADVNSGNSPESGGWNAEGWSDEQSSENDEQQGGWPDEELTTNEGTAAGWDNSGAGPWNSPNQNGWVNEPPQAQSPNEQSSNSWQPQGNGGNGGPWVVNPQQTNPEGGESGWIADQQGGGWTPPVQSGGNQGGPNSGWNNNQAGWNRRPAAVPSNSWQNNGQVSDNVGWNNNQQNVGGWNNDGGGSNGWQDGNLSWKVYNEDTKTMENIDDNSGWKVIGDGGPDGWKLVDENGNIEWKIENINGEWRVTSADEFSNGNNTTAVTSNSSINATSDTNETSVATTTTTTSPSGGWDDDKQGRYIIWKFSEDGKGEARVYGSPGSEPEVWTVGDNNQWWKETMGVKEADTVVQGGYNPGNGKWQGNGRWQNRAPQTNNAPVQNGNGRWQAGGSQKTRPSWQQNNSPGNGRAVWQNNGPPRQNGGNTWQAGNSQRGNKRWQNKAGSGTQQKWNNGVSYSQNGNRWQNQARQPPGWNSRNPVPPATNGWQNSGPTTQPQGGAWQIKPDSQQVTWQNGATRNAGGWSNGSQVGGKRAKGSRRSNGNPPSARWVSNNGNSRRKNGVPKGTVWNSGNGWQTAPSTQVQGNGRWANNVPASTGASPTAASPSGRSLQNEGSQAPQGEVWNEGGGQTVPYIIVIKAPDTGTTGGSANRWVNGLNGTPVPKKSRSNTDNSKPQSNRRNSGWKMNRAGSSGWQWNPEGGNEGWQWRDGWMGSGGGFGGWVGDKGTMYSDWKPTKMNDAQERKSSQKSSSDRGNKKSSSKMVFVFGTKRSSGDAVAQPLSKGKKGKQVIIIDYTTGGKKPPTGDEGMKKDIESVIKALKSAKPTGIRGSAVWKQPG